jgi:threonylcarbamoyladenosine tRNA methylthiotransferase MtaB
MARQARRLNPQGRICTGRCADQLHELRVRDTPRQVVRMLALDEFVLRAVHDQIPADEGRILVHNQRKEEQVTTLGAAVFSGQTRAFLKVQEGCDLFCTFCIVPFARGRSRSVAPRRVLAELERLAANGFREVVLTDIHLGGYGRISRRADAGGSVEMIADASPVPRIRLSSIDPPEVTPRLLDLVRRSAVLCRISTCRCRRRRTACCAACSGLGRRHGARRRDQIVRALPDAALGRDVIAGAPGERGRVADGLELLGAPFTYFHVFPLSRRTGTPAASGRTCRRDGPRAGRRCAASGQRSGATSHGAVGAALNVLVESTRDRESGHLVGYSRHYARVLLDGPDALANREVRTRALARHGDRVLGVRVHDPA